MFAFCRARKSKKSVLGIVNALLKISDRCKEPSLKPIITKLHKSKGYNSSWEDIDKKLNDLISQLTYSLNDNNTKIVLLKYIEKLIDSRIGLSNYYEQLEDPIETQIQKYDIMMNKYLDEASTALTNYENASSETEQSMHEFVYKAAIAELQQMTTILHDLVTRARVSDIERKKQIFDELNISDKVKSDVFEFTFYNEGINEKTRTNAEASKLRYGSNLDNIALKK